MGTGHGDQTGRRRPPGEMGSGKYLQGHLVPGSGRFVQGCHPVSGAEVQVSPAVSESFDHLRGVVQLRGEGQRGLYGAQTHAVQNHSGDSWGTWLPPGVKFKV